MALAPLSVHEFHAVLCRGDLARLVDAVAAGTDLHPELPFHLCPSANSVRVLSPLGLAWHWDWSGQPVRCLGALKVLVQAGADTNLPDTNDSRPLHALVARHQDNLPVAATRLLLDAQANPLLESVSPSNGSRGHAIGECMRHVLVDHLRAMLGACPAANARPAAGGMTPMEWLAANARDWTDEAGQELTRALLEFGADPRQAHPSARAWQWVEWVQADNARRQLDHALPAPAPRPPGPTPRL